MSSILDYLAIKHKP